MAGFGRNGSRSSAKAIASAERHSVWLALRRQGHSEADIARRYGVSQQAVSKALLKHVRDLPAGEAELLRQTHAAYLALMYKMANEACERAQSDKILLKFIITAVHVMERQAKLLGLDAAMRNRKEPSPDLSHVQPTIWNVLAQAGPTDLETIKRIQELDPIEKPDDAKEP
jgi:predicted transcriptional regulator